MPVPVRRGSGAALLGAVVLAVACAHIRPLEGGAADKTPPELVAMVPADSSRGLGPLPVLQLRFSEALHTGSASGAVRTYPAQPRPDVRVRGTQVEIRYRDSLPADTTLVVVLGRALQDAPGRDNKLPQELWFVFATGDSLTGGAVRGRVLVKGKPEPHAAVRFEFVAAPAPAESLMGRDAASVGEATPAATSRPAARPRYPVAATDDEGLFTLRGIPTGVPFVLRAFVDRNASLDIDEGELAAALPETLRLGLGETRRGLEWNLVDPREPGQVHGVVFNRTTVAGPIAVALQALDPDTSAAPPPGRRPGGAFNRAPGSIGADRDSTPARADADSTGTGADSLGGTRPAAALDTLAVAEQGPWSTAYASLGPVGARRTWQVVYASARGDYSMRVRPGRHRLAAFVDVSGDSLPGTHVAADSSQRLWEPLWVGGVVEVAPAAEIRPRAIDIDTPR